MGEDASVSERFRGTIEEFSDVNVSGFPLDNAENFRSLATILIHKYFPGCVAKGIGLWEVAPGHIHPAHTDPQPSEWVTRIHIPLKTNPHCVATMSDGPHQMLVGKAYQFNTEAEHAVSNGGKEPRVHLIIEVHHG